MKKLAILAVLCMASAAAAGEAVSSINGKASYLGGSMEGESGNNVLAGGSVPLASNFGLQLDGLYTHVSHRDFYGWGDHLFWRDWDKGLVGLTASGIHQDDIESLRAGFEGELYLGPFTPSVSIGVANFRYKNGPYPFIDDDVTDLFAGAGLRYYPWEDLMISTSYLHIFDNELVLGTLEYQTPIQGLSLVAQLARGEHGYDHALFGLQFYFGGPKKSLMLRHRQDEPSNLAQETLYGVGLYGAEFNQRAKRYIREHPAPQGGQYTGNYGAEFIFVRPSGVTESSDRLSYGSSIDCSVTPPSGSGD